MVCKPRQSEPLFVRFSRTKSWRRVQSQRRTEHHAMRYHAPSHAERCVDDTVCRPLQLSDQRTHDSQTRWSFRSLTIQEGVFLRVLVAGEVRDDDLPFLQIFLQSDPCSLHSMISDRTESDSNRAESRNRRALRDMAPSISCSFVTRVLNTSSSPFAVTATVDTLRLGLCIRQAQGGVRVVCGRMARGVHTKLKLHHGRGQVTENVELDLELGVDLLDAVVRELHRNHAHRPDLRERPSDQQSKRTRARSSRAVPFPGDNGLILIDTYQPDGLQGTLAPETGSRTYAGQQVDRKLLKTHRASTRSSRSAEK